MIYTITFNPALDYYMNVNQFRLGEVNRAESERMKAGGKGINVSIVLHNLGMDTKALGFLAGFTGVLIARILKDLPKDFIALPEGNSRINMKICSPKDETDINGIGAEITEMAMYELFQKLDAMQEGDTLVLAGSVPNGASNTMYADMMERYKSKKIRFAVDASGELLKNAVAKKPFIVKPNHVELGELFGVRPTTPKEVERYARLLQEMGAQNVLVSMGDRGALLLGASGEVYFRRALRGKAVTTTGAGDSMLAGFLVGWEKYHDEEKALLMGIAAASASVFSGSLAVNEDVQAIFETLNHSTV